MLDLRAVDLDALAEAMEDHSDFLRWFVDPTSGEVLAWSDDMDEPHPEEAGNVYVSPLPSHEAYEDLRDFVAQVPERRARDLLSRAIEGRGAFRRFKDTLFEFPELRESWFAFHDLRMRRRAIEWLVDAGLVDSSAAEDTLAELHEPSIGDGVVDPFVLAHDVGVELAQLFGPRLVDVAVFGSYATGTATEDSDLDLAVVLSDVESPWDDARRMDGLLWGKTRESGITLSAVVVDAADWDQPRSSVLRSAPGPGPVGGVSDPAGLIRAPEELAAAQLLAENAFAAQAVSRSYFAAFYAAEAALLSVGEVRSKHAGVVAAVARALVRDRGLNPETGRLLRSLFERRSRADDDIGDTPAVEAGRAVADATTVVDLIQKWMSSSQ